MRFRSKKDRKTLQAAQIDSWDQLVELAQADPNFLDQFGADMQGRILSVIAHETSQRSRPLLQTRYRAHALDVVVLTAVLLVAFALWRDHRVADPTYAIVARSSGLQPFHVIAPSDVRINRQTKSPMSKSGAFAGRYTTEFIPAGSPIDSSKLSSGTLLSDDLSNRFLIHLKIQPTNLFSGMNPPFGAALLAAPHERGTTALFLDDVLVLDLRREGDGLSAVLAIPSTDESTLAAFMARSDLSLVVRRP